MSSSLFSSSVLHMCGFVHISLVSNDQFDLVTYSEKPSDGDKSLLPILSYGTSQSWFTLRLTFRPFAHSPVVLTESRDLKHHRHQHQWGAYAERRVATLPRLLQWGRSLRAGNLTLSKISLSCNPNHSHISVATWHCFLLDRRLSPRQVICFSNYNKS